MELWPPFGTNEDGGLQVLSEDGGFHPNNIRVDKASEQREVFDRAAAKGSPHALEFNRALADQIS